jgi:multimeric flavodoxin WrbA
VIVVATPVCFYTMSGQMKTLVGRTYPRYLEMSNKEIYFIMTAPAANKQAMESTLDRFRAFASFLKGAKENGVIYGTGGWTAGDIKGSEATNQAYEMAKAI